MTFSLGNKLNQLQSKVVVILNNNILGLHAWVMDFHSMICSCYESRIASHCNLIKCISLYIHKTKTGDIDK